MNGIVNDIAVDRIGITIDCVSLRESMFSANKNVFIKLVPTNNTKKCLQLLNKVEIYKFGFIYLFNSYELNK